MPLRSQMTAQSASGHQHYGQATYTRSMIQWIRFLPALPPACAVEKPEEMTVPTGRFESAIMWFTTDPEHTVQTRELNAGSLAIDQLASVKLLTISFQIST